MSRTALVLKPGKEKPLLQKHHWIFSGAVAKLPDAENGSLAEVRSHEGRRIGTAYLNRKSSILGRMVAFGEEEPLSAIRRHILEAYALRKALLPKDTTAFRLINGEGDALPGLIVDCYGPHLVLQIGTLGMEKLKPVILNELTALLSPVSILEKSELPSRKEEGLQPFKDTLLGSVPVLVEVKENGLNFFVDLLHGQKTGFFLDQREMRREVGERACGKRVLNCFGYTGGFSVYAAAGGAKEVATVDISADAIALAKKNLAANTPSGCALSFYTEDAFTFLKNELPYDLVVLDPPAFAKKAKDVVPACRGYKEINRLAMQKMPKGSLLITCSCSYHVDASLFQKVVFQAAIEAGREVRIIGRHRQAVDHPVNLYHPEGDYLKSLILAIV